jgi:hypothetical protein
VAIAGSDWHDAAAYARLLAADRRCFAWEWLRRTPEYHLAWSSGGRSDRFGLARLEDPGLDALVARPLWTANVDRAVLSADGRAAGESDRLDWSSLAPFTTIVSVGRRHKHILLSDGLRSIRVDLSVSSSVAKPAMLTWHIPSGRGVGLQLAALAQFDALIRLGRFSRSLHPPERRARRWIAMLRVHDALAIGATNREIVTEMFDVPASAARWRSAVGPWRLRVQRLAAGARACLAMGPAGWLGGEPGQVKS